MTITKTKCTHDNPNAIRRIGSDIMCLACGSIKYKEDDTDG